MLTKWAWATLLLTISAPCLRHVHAWWSPDIDIPAFLAREYSGQGDMTPDTSEGLPPLKKSKEFERLSPEQRVEYCEATYQDLYQGIFADLKRWNSTGITMELVSSAMKAHTTHTDGQKGFAAGFYKGKAVLPDTPALLQRISHHVGLQFVYMHALVDLEKLFGPLLPDVEFVISTMDRPVFLASDPFRGKEPVLRFCKSNSHSDLLIPIFHFYMKEHNSELIDEIPKINKEYPWSARTPQLFGRFSPYLRHIHPDDPYTARKGFNGTKICRNDTLSVHSCKVRHHFIDWSKNHTSLIDVDRQPRIKMAEHARYKYLAHIDGQGLSSRIDQLLPLGSVVFKEESGYRSYYFHLLKPFVHFVPFWKHVPEDVLEMLAWARNFDAKSERIGANAQSFAERYLSRAARACYWYKLVREYAALLRYEPGPGKHPRAQYYRSIADFLGTDAREWQQGRWYNAYPFSP